MSRPPNLAAKRLRSMSALRPSLAIVLGSGFQRAIKRIESDVEIPFAKLPGFPPTGVSGHAGKVVIGRLAGTPVLILSGRAHYYEGHSLDRVTFPIRVLAEFGIRDLLLTNAAGGINRRFRPGDFMVLTDHINFMGANPLRGAAIPGRAQFVDLTRTYDAGLAKLLQRSARLSRLRLRTGVYAAVSGPSYETPAEIQALARLGGDAVGMSTVPESIVGRQCGLRVAAISCITNLAAGLSRREISHEEVLETGKKVEESAARFLWNFAKLYGARET
jgi:purine-nucleoside phosphorylase